MAGPGDAPIGPIGPVDPELLEYALMHLAATPAERRGEVPVAVAVAEAYVEWIGIDAAPGEDALSDEDTATIIAVSQRLIALGELRASGLVDMDMNDDDERLILIDAASQARVFGTKSKPAFQLLDFMAVLQRVRASW